MADTACAVKTPNISAAFISKEGQEILSSMKAPRYVDYINILFGRVFAEEYLNNDSYITLSDFTDDSGEKLTKNGNLIKLYNRVKEQLNTDINSNFYDSLPISTVNDILKVYRNWDLFIDYHSKYNAFININEDLTSEEKESFDKRGNEYSEFELVSNEVRTLFKFLPRAEFVTDVNGNLKIEESYDPIDGLPLRSDYENVFKLTLDALKGIKDEDKFIETLTSDDLLKKIPELEFLFKILPLKDNGLNSLLNKQRLLFNSFYTTFSRDYIPVHASTRIVQEEEKLPIHIRYKSTKGNTDKIERQFISNFSSNQEENQHIKIDNSEDERNPERAGYGRRRLYSLPKKLERIELTDDDLNKITIDKIQSRYKDYFNFLRLIGVEFSDLSLLKSNKDKTALIKILNSVLTIHDNITDRIEKGVKIYNPISDITGERIPYMDENSKVKIIPRLTNTVKDIVKFEGTFSKISPTIMSRGASGEKQSDISYSNTLSIAANQISTVNSLDELYQKSYFKKLKYNPLHKDSFVSREVIGKGNKYTIENYSGHVIESGEDTINSDTRSLSDVEKFKSDFSNLLGWGRINTPQLEAKSGYFSLNFMDKNDKVIIPYNTTNFENGFISDSSAFTSQVLSYLRGELQRIKDYKTMKKSHNIPKAYGELHIFKDMVSNKQLDTLLTTDWDVNSSVIQEIKPAIEKYFQDQFNIGTNFIAKNDITDLITQQSLENQNLTEELYRESPQVYQDLLLRTFIANDFIHNVEFGIFMSGDPLFYKDWHKRLGGLASTGVQPSNTNNLRQYFNSDSEKLYWDNYSLRGILNQYQEKPVQRRDNFDTFLSSVMPEDTVRIEDTSYGDPQTALDYIYSVELNTGKTISLEQAIKDLKALDKTIDVGDGQGYLNMDAHRELSIKQDTYRPQHDVSYKYEALIFKRDILEKELTKGEAELFLKLQGQILRDPNKYALPILKQTYYGTLANEEVNMDAKVFDKFSLAPLLPSMAKNHPKLKALLMAMATRQIHYVKYESGTKGYVRDRYSINDLANEKTELDELQSELLKLQITPPKEEKTSTKLATQETKLLYTNLFDKGESSDKIKELRDDFITNLNSIQATNKKQVLDKLGFNLDKEGNITSWNKDKIIDRVINQINIQKLPSNLLEALQTNNEGEFVNTIESSGVYQQLLNYITGKLDSSLREFKVNGGDFVLFSESMFSTPLKYFKLSKDKSVIEALECRVTLTKEFSKLLNLQDPKKASQKIGTIDRLNELLKDSKFTEKYKKELTITFSRPPVQGPNSMGFGTVVEFFSPTAGNILQLPREFMHQAGIDFDYDKEKVMIPSLTDEGLFLSEENIQQRLTELENEHDELRDIFAYVDEYMEESESYEDFTDFNTLKISLLGGDNFTKLLGKIFNIDTENLDNIPERLIDIENKAFEYLSLKFKEKELGNNRLLSSKVNSLQTPALFSELILPNTDSVVRPLAIKNGEDINNINTLPVGNSVYTYFENLKVFKMFNDAKALLGPFALQNVFSQLIAPLDIKMNLDYMHNKDGVPQRSVNNLLLNNKSRIISISAREDENGQNRQHLNSQFINSTVDSAKDPYFANFMLSFDNINVFMFLFNMGYPIQTIVDFTSSAIVRKYIELKNKNPYLKPEELATLTLKETGLPHKSKITMTELLGVDEGLIGIDNTGLLSNLKHLKKEASLSEQSQIQNHKALLVNFIAMEYHARQLSTFKGLFDNDTNKTTSLFEIFSKEMTRNKVISIGMFSKNDIEKIEQKSTMTAFRNDDIIGNVLKTVFPIVSQTDVVNTLGDIFSQRKSTLKEVESRILSQIITNDYIGAILFTYGFYKDGNIYDYAKDLVRKRKKEDGTYNSTLIERIYKFKQNKEYSQLLETFSVLGKIAGSVSTKPLKGNPVYNNKYGFNVLLDIDPNIPLIQKENYMNQFKQIIEGEFETKDPQTKEALINFVKDFFIAGLIQSGFNKTGISFLEYIPIKFTQELLKPALTFYNFEIEHRPDNFSTFLSQFEESFKLNNSNYFYLTKEEKKVSTKSSYLGKTLRVMAYPEWFYKEYDKPADPAETPVETASVIVSELVSRYTTIEDEVGKVITIGNGTFRLLSAIESEEYSDVKDLRLQSKSGLIVNATIDEQGTIEIEPNEDSKGPAIDKLFGLGRSLEDIEFHINTINTVSKFLEAVGVKQELVPEFLAKDGSIVKGALAAANFINGTVEIIDDLNERPGAWNKLPEEAAHWWYRLLNNNSELKNALLQANETYTRANELVDKNYANQDFMTLTEEAIGQLIAEAIKRIEEKNGAPEDYSFLQKFIDWINSVIDLFKNLFKEQDPFEVAAMKILASDMTELMSWQEYNTVYNHVYPDTQLSNQSIAPLDYTLISDIGDMVVRSDYGWSEEDWDASFQSYQWIPKDGQNSPIFSSQQKLDNWVFHNVKQYENRQRQTLQEVKDNQIFFERLLNKTHRKRSKFLPKTLSKYYQIVDSNTLNQMSEWSIDTNALKISSKLRPEEKKILENTLGYTNISPTLKVLPEILKKYGAKTSTQYIKDRLELTGKRVNKSIDKEEHDKQIEILNKKNGIPIVLSEKLKIDGAKKQELEIIQGIIDLIKQENPDKKTITAEELVSEVHTFLTTNFMLGFANENNYLTYRIDQAFTNVPDRVSNLDFRLGDLTEQELLALPTDRRNEIANILGLTKQNPEVYHNKISLRFNDNYHNKGGHFQFAPSAWANLTYFYTGEHDYKDAVLLHEIQNDNIEFLREFKPEKIDLDTRLGTYLQSLNNQLLDNITRIETGGKRIINKLGLTESLVTENVQNPLSKTTLGYWLTNNGNTSNLNNFKQWVEEKVNLYEASNDTPEKLQIGVNKIWSNKRQWHDVVLRGGLKSILSKNQIAQLQAILYDIQNTNIEDSLEDFFTPEIPLKEKKLAFIQRTKEIVIDINEKLVELYGKGAIQINRLEVPALPLPKARRANIERFRNGRMTRSGNSSNDLNTSVKYLFTYNEKRKTNEINDKVIDSKKDMTAAYGRRMAYTFNKQLLKINQEQFDKLIENHMFNISLLKQSIELQAKKDLEKTTSSVNNMTDQEIIDQLKEPVDLMPFDLIQYDYTFNNKKYSGSKEEVIRQIRASANTELSVKEQQEKFEQLKEKALKKKAELEENYGKLEDEIRRTLEIEMAYFTPLVHHAIQKHISQVGKNIPMFFSGFNVTKLTQGNERTALIYAGKEELVDRNEFMLGTDTYGVMQGIHWKNRVEITIDEYTEAYKKASNPKTIEQRARLVKYQAAQQIGLIPILSNIDGELQDPVNEKKIDEAIKKLAEFKRQSKQNMDRVVNTIMNISHSKPIETGAIYNAMSQISGVKLIWKDKIKGLQGEPGGYFVDLSGYNFNAPILYAVSERSSLGNLIKAPSERITPSMEIENTLNQKKEESKKCN